MSVIVSTSPRPEASLIERAARFGEWLQAPVLDREGSLQAMCDRHVVTGIVVVRVGRATYHEPASGMEYFYHPGMVKVRLHSQRRGDPDPLLTAMALEAGDSVLDCTLGRGSDAVLCSHVVGETGRVVGIESSPILAAITHDGILHHQDPSRRVTAALRRVECIHGSYDDYLPTLPDKSFDIVYFDPLFHEPVLESQAMAVLRQLADPSPLTAAALTEARRVARRAVVIKQRRGSPLWAELGVRRLVGARRARVEYGVVTP